MNMFKIKLMTLIALLSMVSTLLAQNKNELYVSHELKAVTVFLNNAEIQREGKVQVPKGESVLVFDQLSSKLLNKGIFVEADNDLEDYSSFCDHFADNQANFDKDAAYVALNKELNEIEEQLVQVDSDNALLDEQLSFLKANMDVSSSTLSTTRIDQAEVILSEKSRKFKKSGNY